MAVPSVIKPDAKMAVGVAVGVFLVPKILKMVHR